MLFLQGTKTGQRNQLQWEKVLIYEATALRCLVLLCHKRRPDKFLTDESPAKLRELWKDVVHHLHLDAFNYLPYSLRRGGATSAYRAGATFDSLLIRGRWKHLATARLYLDQALQE